MMKPRTPVSSLTRALSRSSAASRAGRVEQEVAPVAEPGVSRQRQPDPDHRQDQEDPDRQPQPLTDPQSGDESDGTAPATNRSRAGKLIRHRNLVPRLGIPGA